MEEYTFGYSIQSSLPLHILKPVRFFEEEK